jgi:hypothetical protein
MLDLDIRYIVLSQFLQSKAVAGLNSNKKNENRMLKILDQVPKNCLSTKHVLARLIAFIVLFLQFQ